MLGSLVFLLLSHLVVVVADEELVLKVEANSSLWTKLHSPCWWTNTGQGLPRKLPFRRSIWRLCFL